MLDPGGGSSFSSAVVVPPISSAPVLPPGMAAFSPQNSGKAKRIIRMAIIQVGLSPKGKFPLLAGKNVSAMLGMVLVYPSWPATTPSWHGALSVEKLLIHRGRCLRGHGRTATHEYCVKVHVHVHGTDERMVHPWGIVGFDKC